jgi:hydrogenase-4 membrane subunit HyfE
MFTTIFFTAEGMLAISFILLGASTANQEWLTQGIVMVLLPLVLFFLKNSVKKAIVGKKEIKTLMLLDIFFITLTTAYVTYTYFIADINNTEKASIITFAVWSLLGIIFYMKETKQADITIEKVSSVRTVSHLDINQPIKLPK